MSRTASRPAQGLRPWAPWIAVLAVVLIGLAFGTLSQGTPSDEVRAQNLASTIRCPSCVSQSAASSDTPSSEAVRALIRERIAEGDTDEEIRDFVASRYGREVLLDPAASGFSALVWALPVAVVIVAVAGLAFRFRDYRPGRQRASDADRDLVADALGSQERS